MARNFMAHPDQRHPFDETPLHEEGAATVLHEGQRITLQAARTDGDRLLIQPEDLPRVNGFDLKPQGACLGELCIPLRDDLFVEQGGRRWFDLTAFADLLEQPWVADPEANAWSFAEVPAKRQGMLENAQAPDFEVQDREGKVIRMADFRGKKALVVTWSSW